VKPLAAGFMGVAIRIRRSIPDVLAVQLSVELVGQLVRVVERWMQPLLQLLATALPSCAPPNFPEDDL